MSYNKESKKAYLERSTKGFAYELYLLSKYKAEENIDIMWQLHEYLNCGWHLTDKEKNVLIKSAKKIAKKQFGLKES